VVYRSGSEEEIATAGMLSAYRAIDARPTPRNRTRIVVVSFRYFVI
jgi:hypothetical protein